MKELLRYGITLSVICMAASGLLAGVHALTREKISAQATKEERAALVEVMPQADSFEAVIEGNETLYYRAFDKEKILIGVAFKAQGKGYGGAVETLAGMRLDGSLSAVKVLSQNETPGIGQLVTEPSFTDQFKMHKADTLDGVQAITGATISSRAVIDAVKLKAREIQELLKNDR